MTDREVLLKRFVESLADLAFVSYPFGDPPVGYQSIRYECVNRDVFEGPHGFIETVSRPGGISIPWDTMKCGCCGGEYEETIVIDRTKEVPA